MLFTSVYLFVDHFVQFAVFFDEFGLGDTVPDGLFDPPGHVRVIGKRFVCSQLVYVPPLLVDFATHVMDGLFVHLLNSLLRDVSPQLVFIHFAETYHEQSFFSFGVLIPAFRDDGSSERV